MTRKATPPDNLPLPYGTWVMDRVPQFKVHSSIGMAKNALAQQVGPSITINGKSDHHIRGGYLYGIVDSKWVCMAVIPHGSFRHEHLLWTQAKKWRQAPGITTLITETPFVA